MAATGHFETKKPCRARVLCLSLAPLAADTQPECVSLKPSLSSGRLHLLSLVCRMRTLQDCSDRVLAEPDMAADQPVAQTSICQLEDLRRLAVRWTLSWVAAEPFTAGLGGGDVSSPSITMPFSVGGLPALAIPCGFSRAEGLPLSLQIAAPPMAEPAVLRIAHAYQ